MSVIYSKYSDNLARSKTCTVDSGTEDTSYPATNLVDGDVTKPAKLTTTTGRWLIDLGAAYSLDVVALVNHNLDAALAGVTICANDTGVYADPMTVSAKTITIPSDRDDGMCTNAALDISSDVTTARYWFLNFANANSAAIAIGELWLGSTARTMSYLQNPSEWQDERRTYENETPAGVHLTYDHGVTVRHFSADLTLSDSTAHTAFRTLMRDARGSVRPWLFWPDSGTNDALVVRFAGDPVIRRETVSVWRVAFALREVSMGVPL